MNGRRTRELEPDVREHARPRASRGAIVIDDFAPLAALAAARNVPADGFLAAAVLQRLRFVAGGRAWNGRFSFDATTRACCVLRSSEHDAMDGLRATYAAIIADPVTLAAAKLDPMFLDGVFDAL